MRPSPQLQLETLYVLDERRRLHSTREPRPSPVPAFVFIRGAVACAWATRADVGEREAAEIDRLASQERPSANWDEPLLYARRYQDIVNGQIRWGPAFEFPDALAPTTGTSLVRDEQALRRHFSGWAGGEIDTGRAPVMAVYDGDHPVSICFCARRSATAAEAGVDTAPAFRGRGYAPRVVAAWAQAVRSEGLIPIYSTDRQNCASIAVARKLALVPFATDFSIDVSNADTSFTPP